MLLFDNLIKSIKMNHIHSRAHVHLEGEKYELSNDDEIIFPNETAFELGGGSLPAIGATFITSSDLFCDNKIILIGKELSEIKKDTPFARIALLKVDDDKLGKNTNEIYQSLRKLDYVRYHVSLKGTMVRISPLSKRESIRISKDAIKKGLNFAKIGQAYIDAYLKKEEVKSATIVFITDPDSDYEELNKLMEKEENIIKTLDHLASKVKMDCSSCNLQVVCDEVEDLINSEKQK